MNRESSHGTKELFNLPSLVLKARHLSGSAFCMSIIGVPEQALGWLATPRLGLVIEDKPTELSCTYGYVISINPQRRTQSLPILSFHITELFVSIYGYNLSVSEIQSTI